MSRRSAQAALIVRALYIGFVGIVLLAGPILGLLYAINSGLMGLAILSVLILVQAPVFFLFRRVLGSDASPPEDY
jgi:hypothetical protein